MKKEQKSHSNLEKEVIVVVTILYLLMMGALLVIHYIQPTGQGAVTSSSSPSHNEGESVQAPDSKAIEERNHDQKK